MAAAAKKRSIHSKFHYYNGRITNAAKANKEDGLHWCPTCLSDAIQIKELLARNKSRFLLFLKLATYHDEQNSQVGCNHYKVERC